MSRKNKKSAQRANRLKKHAKRLAAYSAAAAATALTTTNNAANAAEVIHDVPDVTVGLGKNVWFNMAAGTTTTAGVLYYGLVAQGSFRIIGRWNTFDGSASTWNNPYIYGYNSSGIGFARSTNRSEGLGYFDNAANLPAGAAFGASANIFSGNGSYPSYGRAMDIGDATSWGGDGYINGPPVEIHGFLGLRFELDTNTHYGWAEVTRAPGDVQYNITLHGFGYNDVPGELSKTGGADAADFDNDGDVDGNDFLTWQRGFGTLMPDGTNAIGDADYDTAVDGNDLGVWSAQFGNTNGGGSTIDPVANAAGVPEPSSILLLALGAAGLAGWRRRRAG